MLLIMEDLLYNYQPIIIIIIIQCLSMKKPCYMMVKRSDLLTNVLIWLMFQRIKQMPIGSYLLVTDLVVCHLS